VTQAVVEDPVVSTEVKTIKYKTLEYYKKGLSRRLDMAETNEQLQHFYIYLKFLDETNAKILKELAKHGPRNVSNLAKATHLPITTVRFRLKKMIDNGLLLVTVNPNLPRLGLAKAFLVTDSKLGRHKDVLERIMGADYWNYIIRCFGKMDGYCAYFAFPARQREELEEYFRRVYSDGVLSSYKLLWITNSHYVSPDFTWYDFRERKWKLQWDEWVDQIHNVSEHLPDVLEDPENFEAMADKADLLIIKELEKDATIDLKKLAEMLKITPQSVGSRYQKHVVERKLIANYNVDIYPFPIDVSDLFNSVIDFKNEEALGRFVNASRGKPFVVSYAKVIGKNSLVTNFYILKREFSNLIETLNRLYREKLINNFSYVTLDPTSYNRQTIAYKNFEDGKWTCDLNKK
jgi:DNA-binding Lrp family transcriptional regulator